MKTIYAREIMSSPVITVDPHTKVTEAHKIMVEKRIRRLPVVANGVLVGIVSMLDVSEAKPQNAETLRPTALYAYIAMMNIEDIMTHRPITITPDTTVMDIARLLARHKISSLPVLEGGHLVGIVTESDTFRAIVRSADESARA